MVEATLRLNVVAEGLEKVKRDLKEGVRESVKEGAKVERKPKLDISRMLGLDRIQKTVAGAGIEKLIGGTAIAGAVGGFVGGATVGILNMILGILKAIFNWVMSGLTGTMKLLDKIGSILKLILKPLDLVLMGILLPILYMLSPLVKILLRMLMPFSRAFMKQVKAMRPLIETLGPLALPTVYATAFISGMTALLQPVLDILIDIATYISTVFVEALTELGVAILSVVDALFGTNLAEQFANSMNTVVSNIQFVGQFMKETIGIVAHTLEGYSDEVVNYLETNKGTVTDIMSGIAENITRLFTESGIEKHVNALREYIASSFTSMGMMSAGAIRGMKANIVKDVVDMSNKVRSTLGLTVWEIKWRTEWICNNFKALTESIASYVRRMIDKLSSVLKIRTREKEKGGGGGFRKAGDLIITRKGDVIQTSPQDYIFAMKSPSMGGTVNIYINGVIDEALVDRLAWKLTSRGMQVSRW